MTEATAQISSAISNSIITIVICGAVIALISLALMIWFVWIMHSINRNTKNTTKFLTAIAKQLSAVSSSVDSLKASQITNQVNELSKYKTLLDQGAITQEEYEIKRCV